MKIKFLIFFLIASLSVQILFSCSPNNTNDVPTAENNGITENTENIHDTIDLGYQEDLPKDIRYDGMTLTIATQGNGTDTSATATDIAREEMSGEPINDAIWIRNDAIRNKYGVTIGMLLEQTPETLRRNITSGTHAFDAIWFTMSNAGNVAQHGFLLDLLELPYLNLGKKYWDQAVTRDLSIGGKIFYATGDISIVDNDFTWAVCFNKKMVNDYNLPNLYELVRSGEWTLDNFNDIIKDISRDLNGDGIFDENDMYGLATYIDTITGLFYASDLRWVSKDANGMAQLNTFDTAKMQYVLEKCINIMREENSTMITQDYIDKLGGWNAIMATRNAFVEDRALFYSEVIYHVRTLREMNTDFGILPLPKYDAAQKNYNTFVHPVSIVLSVPVDCHDKEFTGLIIEALAAESARTLTPAYYDISLVIKGTRDEESVEMLDILLQNRSYDIGLIYEFGSLPTLFRNLVDKKENTLASMLEKNSSKAYNAIENFNKQFENIK